MPHAAVNGQELYFEDSGGDGPPIVLSHGFLMDHEMFHHQVTEFTPAYRVVTWDERGFGETRTDGKPFTYWDSARDLFGLLDHLGIERAVLGGMSQGGYLSLRAALLQPDRVRALVLIDTQAPPEDDDKIAGYQVMIDQWVAGGYQEELASVVAGLIIGDPEEEPRWKAKWRRWPAERLVQAGPALLDRDDISERIPEIDAPTLIVHGGDDLVIPVERAEQLQSAISDCRGLVVVDGAGHVPNLTHPEAVNAAMRSFLQGLPG
ncbi:alpha/beta fold hydrolase [Nitriliruptor alkaliphilus]|uniref:alpha/beta fold hydrolase n=1 Tax=Nitriliruptor alkaliphilus TaxID=427918 RepID=UPI000698E391|nr:alpha/beta hydrolase [Nitriliruptor alkaliphilus]